MTDIRGIKRPFFPFIVIGANSILAYCLSHVFPAVAFNAGRRILGPEPFRVLGAAYEPAVYGAFVLLGYWLVLFVLYRWKIFVRIDSPLQFQLKVRATVFRITTYEKTWRP